MTKRKLYLGPLTDNRRWDSIDLRDGDIIVATPPKSGTTWMQTLIALLLSGDPDIEPELATNMPWVDFRLREIEDVATRIQAMTNRRSLKSHTPLDGLPFDERVHYICVFRHPLDAHFSYRNHWRIIPLPFFGGWFPENDETGVTFRRFLDGGAEGFDGDAMPLAHILRHYEKARALADRPNVSLFHYADMTRDLPSIISRLAQILGVMHPPKLMEDFVRVASFGHMKANAARYAPGARPGSDQFNQGFFQSGSSGKWKGVLSGEEVAAYDAIMDRSLTPKDRAWLEYGSTGKH